MKTETKPYLVVAPKWAIASCGNVGRMELDTDGITYGYSVKVEVFYDNWHGYVDSRNESSSWYACRLDLSGEAPCLKTRKGWHGLEPDWFGDSVGTDRCPEVETLADRAKDALERYLSGKSKTWWKHRFSEIARSLSDFTELKCRLPKRKGFIVCARIEFGELITPDD